MGRRQPRAFDHIAVVCLSVACGRTSLEFEGSNDYGSLTAGGASAVGVAGSSSAAAGGRAGSSPPGGLGGGDESSGGSGGAGATASTGGQGANSPRDRCATPGPPPAWGAADGSEYEFGDVLEVARNDYQHLAVADLNGDQRPDLVASDYFLPIISFLQLAPSGFDAGTETPDLLVSGFAPSYGMKVADFGGGAAPDVIVARGMQHGLSVFMNDGSGSLHNTQTIEGYSLSTPTSWDIDGDGDLDALALANDETYVSNPSQLVLYENDGRKLAFARAVDLSIRGLDLRVADVTGDGAPEVLVKRESPARVVVLGQSSFNELALLDEIVASGSTDPNLSWYQVGDVDGDAANDVVMVEDEQVPDIERLWIAHQRNGALGPAVPIDTLPKTSGNGAGGSIAIADINLDGLNDIVITSSAFNMVAYLQRGDHSFRRIEKAYPTAGSIIQSAIAVGDLDCDGCPDAAGVQVGHIRIFTGRGCAR